MYGVDSGGVVMSARLVIAVAFGVRQLYRCWASNDGCVKLEETVREQRAYYQSV